MTLQRELIDHGMNLPEEQLVAVVSFLKCEAFDCIDDLAGASCVVRFVASATFGPSGAGDVAAMHYAWMLDDAQLQQLQTVQHVYPIFPYTIRAQIA